MNLKRFLILLLVMGGLAAVIGAEIPGTVVLNKITLGDDAITNKSIGDTREMKGTPKSVADLTARNDIPAVRREEGMECWVIDVAKMYRLVGGILNADWVEVVAASGSSAQSGRVNVVDYGATPYLHLDNSVPVSLALTDQHTFITNAIAAAAASTGHSNVVYFPPGIYPIDRTIWVPKNVFIEGVGVMMANGASPYATTTNNYSMIWRRGQGEAVAFYQVGPGNGNGIRNISIHGYTNPVDSVSLVTAPSAALGTIGIRAFNEDTFWCQRFDMENVSVVGFKIGYWSEINGSSYKQVGTMGCDIGVVSVTTNYFADLVTAGLSRFNGYLGLATNRNGTQRTQFAPGEGTVWVAPCFQERTNSLGYLLEGTRSFTVVGEGSFHIWEYAWLLSSFMDVEGTQLEMDAYSSTNFVRVFGSANTFNLSDAYVNGTPASWCMIRSTAQNILSTLDGVQLNFPNFTGLNELHLLDYPKNSLATLRNNGDRGIVTLNGDLTTYWRADAYTSFHQPGQYQLRNPYYGGADPFATNMIPQIGRVGIQHSHYATDNDYLSAVLWFGDGANQNPRFTRFLNTDPQTAQQVANDGNIIGTNITVGNIRAGGLVSSGTGFAGDGSAISNIPPFRTYIVTEFGATPYLHNDNAAPVNPSSLGDSTDVIQSAINIAAASGGNRNILYFPPGIYKILNTLWVPKNVFILGAGVMMANGASPYTTTTNNYSMIWRIGQGDAVAFYQVGPGNGNGIKDISIHGYTNPVDNVTLVTAPSSTMGNIGLRAYNEDTFWCQRFDVDNVSIVGFKVGFWPEVNGSVFNRLVTMGCDVGLVSTYTNHFSALTTAGLNYFNTNILVLATNRNGTQRTSMARGEASVLIGPSFGERTNSLGYFLAGTRSFTVVGEGSFHLWEFAWLLDSFMDVEGMQLELDMYSGTNFVRAFDSANTFNLSDAYITGSPASWCMIRSRASVFYGSLEGIQVGGLPNFPGSPELHLLDYPKNALAQLHNQSERGITTIDGDNAWYFRNDAQTMYHQPGQFQLRNPVYGGADTFATNMTYQIGRVGLQHSHYVTDNDYLSGVMWFGDGFTQAPRFTRFLSSDPDTAQQVADRGNIINTNFTVGTLRATGNLIASQFIGDGSGLTNLSGGSAGTGMLTNQFTTNAVGSAIVGDITTTGAIRVNGQGLTVYGASGDPTLVFEGGTPAATNQIHSDSGGLKFYFADIADADFTITEDNVTAANYIGAGGGLTLDASGFNGNLTTSDNTVQEVAQKLDDLTAGGGTPGGSDGHVQYNNGGVFGGEAVFFWDDVNKRLGIGTATPEATLDVLGAALIVNPSVAQYGSGVNIAGKITRTDGYENGLLAGIQMVNTGVAYGGTLASQNAGMRGYVQLNSDASANWAAAVAGSMDLFATSVLVNGIGFLAPVPTKAAGATFTSFYGLYLPDGSGVAANTYGIWSDIAASANNYFVYGSGTAKSYFAGNVGIGTATPTVGYLLDVAGKIRASASGVTMAMVPFDGSVGAQLTTIGLDALSLGINSVNKLTISTAGNVGIGTTTPSEKLDVNGNVRAVGNVILEGATDDGFETTITTVDPTADRTVTLQNASGTVAYLGDIPAGGSETNRFYEAGEVNHWVEFGGTNGDPYAVKGSTSSTTVSDWTIDYGGNLESIANIVATGNMDITGTIHTDNNLSADGTFTVTGETTIGAGGIAADGGGLKHGRVTTGSVAALGTASVTLTWGTTFADANYTVSASVVQSDATATTLRIHHVQSVSASAVIVHVVNDHPTIAKTGTVNVIAIHD